MNKTIPRSIEIDFLRSLAIVMMILYHAAYDVHVYRGWGIRVFDPPWTILSRSSACTFLALTGLCFVISWERTASYGKVIRRSIKILAYACIVSITTYMVEPESFVRFGILHLIGASGMLLPLFVRLGTWNALLGVLTISFGAYLEPLISELGILQLPLGFPPSSFTSVDYFPFIPWFGVILIGMSLGWIYVRAPERYTVVRVSEETVQQSIVLRSVRAISSHSLLIYMVHQPIILAILIATQKILLSM